MAPVGVREPGWRWRVPTACLVPSEGFPSRARVVFGGPSVKGPVAVIQETHWGLASRNTQSEHRRLEHRLILGSPGPAGGALITVEGEQELP